MVERRGSAVDETEAARGILFKLPGDVDEELVLRKQVVGE